MWIYSNPCGYTTILYQYIHILFSISTFCRNLRVYPHSFQYIHILQRSQNVDTLQLPVALQLPLALSSSLQLPLVPSSSLQLPLALFNSLQLPLALSKLPLVSLCQAVCHCLSVAIASASLYALSILASYLTSLRQAIRLTSISLALASYLISLCYAIRLSSISLSSYCQLSHQTMLGHQVQLHISLALAINLISLCQAISHSFISLLSLSSLSQVFSKGIATVSHLGLFISLHLQLNKDRDEYLLSL